MSERDSETRTPRVVAVEDNPADVRLVEEGIESAETTLEFKVHKTGGRAIEKLASLAPESTAVHPDLVFLDLNLPEKSGFDVLRTIRTETAFQHVPVVVVSSSENSHDIRRVYELAANAYVVKPVDPDEYIQMVEAAVDFWILHTTRRTQR